MTSEVSSNLRSHRDYTVGWVCALPKEQTAATAMLERHDDLPKPPNDPNTYTLGSMGNHNVVVACLPTGTYGQTQAAAVVGWMISAFPSIKFGLMVGIGGGIPVNDVRLGDVVVSTPVGQYPGVIQWDLGKAKPGGEFERVGTLNRPPISLLTALAKLETEHELKGSKIPTYLEELGEKWPRLATKYLRSGSLKDVLFRSNYEHVEPNAFNCDFPSDEEDEASDDDFEEEGSCLLCDQTKIVKKRKPRDMKVHFGLIASGNQVIKDAVTRDKLNRDLGGRILCVEMEAAGLMNNFPCIIIRGICDYADSHKNDAWQEHAAAIAAAFGKELLECVQASEVDQEQPAKETLGKILDSVSGTALNVKSLKDEAVKREELEILNWIIPISYGPQQTDSFRRHQPGTGQWFLDSSQYQDWLENKGRVLFCPGIPGAGKTILSSIVVDDVNKRFRQDEKVGIAYIYCKFGQQTEQTKENLVASLLKQLAGGLPDLPQSVKDLYSRHQRSQTLPVLNELSMALRSVAANYSRIYILIDALDEIKASNGCRSMFLSVVFSLKMHNANIFATSRPIPEILEKFKEATSVQIYARTNDIQHYLEAQMFRFPEFVTTSEQVQNEVKTAIMESVDGMFLLAQLHIDMLVEQRTLKTTREALKNLPTGSEAYDQVYESTMLRIEEQSTQQANLAKEVLSWIIFAKGILTTKELQHALAVEFGNHKLDEENLREVRYLIFVCAGLVALDETSGIIRLVHYTTQQYFERTHKKWLPSAEDEIATVCVTYLSFDAFGSGICEKDSAFRERLGSYPLYFYAARNWGNHARDALACPSPKFDTTWSAVIEFLAKEPQMEASIQAMLFRGQILGLEGVALDRQKFPKNMSSLHLSSYFGIKEVVSFYLKALIPNARDSKGWTPLSYAANNGHLEVVKLLLEHGADVRSKNEDGRTALSLAAIQNREPVIRLLVKSGASILCQDMYGTTPLDWAKLNQSETAVMTLLEKNDQGNCELDDHSRILAWSAMYGHVNLLKQLIEDGRVLHFKKDISCMRSTLLEATMRGRTTAVKILFEANLYPNLNDFVGHTPLSIAAGRGAEDMVQLFLKHGATIESISGGNPLVPAASFGNLNIVQLLIDRGADVNSDANGRVPLMAAVQKERQPVVTLLLENGANSNFKDSDGRVPLVQAVKNKSEGIVSLLLKYNAKVNCKDRDGWTPLCCAAKIGDEGVAKLLLSHGADVNLKCDDGSTPFSIAVMKGRMAMANILLENDAGPVLLNTEYGQKMLFWAISHDDQNMMRLLLQKGINNQPTWTGHCRTPLSLTIAEGNTNMVKLVLESNAQVDLVDSKGQTPLFQAAEIGNHAVAELLLDSNADANKVDSNGLTPLFLAAERGHCAVARLLLHRGANINKININGQTPLFKAVENGHDSVVQLLLHENAKVNILDKNDQTPLVCAATHGHEEIVKLLFNHQALPIPESITFIQTPLSAASVNGQDAIVKLLLSYNTPVDPKDHQHRTPLMLAALKGHNSIVQLLLDNGAEVNCKDIYGRTPLFWAMYFGNMTTATTLLDHGADPDSKDKKQRSLLAWAIERGQEAMINLLLDYRADIELADEEGRVPLSLAAERGNVDAVRVLLGRGAFVDRLDDQSFRSPLWRAAEAGHKEVVEILIANEAQVDLMDSDGRTPLSRAIKNGHKAVAELLRDSSWDQI